MTRNGDKGATSWLGSVAQGLRWRHRHVSAVSSPPQGALFVFSSAVAVNHLAPADLGRVRAGRVLSAIGCGARRSEDANVIARELVQVLAPLRAFDDTLELDWLDDDDQDFAYDSQRTNRDDCCSVDWKSDRSETASETPAEPSCWVVSLSSRRVVGVQPLPIPAFSLFLALEWDFQELFERSSRYTIPNAVHDDIRRRLQWFTQLFVWYTGCLWPYEDTVAQDHGDPWKLLLLEWLPLASLERSLPDEACWHSDACPEILDLVQQCSTHLAARMVPVSPNRTSHEASIRHWVVQRSDRELWGTESLQAPLVGHVWLQRQSSFVKQSLDAGKLAYSRYRCWCHERWCWAYCLHAMVRSEHVTVGWLEYVDHVSGTAAVPDVADHSGLPTDVSGKTGPSNDEHNGETLDTNRPDNEACPKKLVTLPPYATDSLRSDQSSSFHASHLANHVPSPGATASLEHKCVGTHACPLPPNEPPTETNTTFKLQSAPFFSVQNSETEESNGPGLKHVPSDPRRVPMKQAGRFEDDQIRSDLVLIASSIIEKISPIDEGTEPRSGATKLFME
ncbi:hypothetical protein CCYA_CCYA12G3348 [Cyanidiococcus yangmingshanensis]|nr:hypothetical protein CCYA_CCYA12G3348 [Cyanidiococcus yangmingshanensis]